MPENCVFCDRTKFEERLIHESENFYVIATLGQITDGGYVLLFPKGHVPCMAALSRELFQESYSLGAKIFAAVSDVYMHYFGYPTVFEHGVVGQTIKHAHLHFLPANIDMTGKIRADFPTAEIDKLRDGKNFQETYNSHPEPYLLWTVGGVGYVCWNPPAPFQYLRIVAANLLGRPERADWHNVDPEFDRKLWSETVMRLKPCFA